MLTTAVGIDVEFDDGTGETVGLLVGGLVDSIPLGVKVGT